MNTHPKFESKKVKSSKNWLQGGQKLQRSQAPKDFEEGTTGSLDGRDQLVQMENHLVDFWSQDDKLTAALTYTSSNIN